MVYMMDTVLVDPADAHRYLELLETSYVPAATKRGLTLVACWHTPEDLGEDITVTTIWSFRDFAEWNDLRRKAVLDPAYLEWVEEATPLRKGGTRRFYYPTSFSPLK